jgi:hypothetical protein
MVALRMHCFMGALSGSAKDLEAHLVRLVRVQFGDDEGCAPLANLSIRIVRRSTLFSGWPGGSNQKRRPGLPSLGLGSKFAVAAPAVFGDRLDGHEVEQAGETLARAQWQPQPDQATRPTFVIAVNGFGMKCERQAAADRPVRRVTRRLHKGRRRGRRRR